jgi:hypothetical protein
MKRIVKAATVKSLVLTHKVLITGVATATVLIGAAVVLYFNTAAIAERPHKPLR